MLGERVPPALKVFLLTLAIVDDLGAILIIAIFYTADLSALGAGAGRRSASPAAGVLNRAGVRALAPYLCWASCSGSAC